MARTQKNKATAHHLGLLKAKLAKLRRDLLAPPTKGGDAAAGEGFDVTKSGDSRVGLVGFPSLGKSTLLNKLTGTFSEVSTSSLEAFPSLFVFLSMLELLHVLAIFFLRVASYEFTTLTCIPGVITYLLPYLLGQSVLAETPVPDTKLKTANSVKKGGDKGIIQILKNCDSLLTRLIKHKFGWIFNAPVDAAKLGLHHYHTIVKKPLDLGTLKSKLRESCYTSPLEFAEDKWRPLETQFESLNRRQQQRPVSTKTRCVEPLPLQDPIVENRTLERAESMTNPVEPAALTVPFEKREEEEEACGKRDLAFDEKQRLSEDLQDLPFNKLEAVVQIIKKRNPKLAQQEDEIELDIDSLDLQTLWELYRYVTEYKESLRDAESVHNSTLMTLLSCLQNTLVTSPESPIVTKSVRQAVNDGGSSSSKSSNSGSGSCSSDSDSDRQLRAGI
ncbi:hypothetical protein HID58_072156 [Brassica napus]|uniref:G domain-containing protein n=1 Tax=Brassica napus TaxID=3708 RepID=A0ABQ7Z3T0_BRANA|nr:hypothetical protein HID58_072156 [Brassica napus]